MYASGKAGQLITHSSNELFHLVGRVYSASETSKPGTGELLTAITNYCPHSIRFVGAEATKVQKHNLFIPNCLQVHRE